MSERRLAVAWLLVAALAASAQEAPDVRTGADRAIALLREGDAALRQGGAQAASLAWRRVPLFSNANWFNLEAFSRLSTLSPPRTQHNASYQRLMMEYFDHTPPTWLTDDTRRRVSEYIAWRVQTGKYPEQAPEIGIRAVTFPSGADSPGFAGKRYFWLVPLLAVPGEIDKVQLQHPDIGERPVLIQDDVDALPPRRLPLVGGGWSVVDPLHARAGVPEPKQRAWRFDRCLLGYSLEPQVQINDAQGNTFWTPTDPWYEGQRAIWRLRLRLFHASEDLVGADYAKLAENLADALLRAGWLAWEGFGLQPVDSDGRPRALDAWLTPSAMPNEEDGLGEAVLGNLYFYRCGAEQPPGEWVRVALHEFGHACFPPLGRYGKSTVFEPRLEGYLAQNLLLAAWQRSLAANPDAVGGAEEKLPEWAANLRDGRWWRDYRRTTWDPLVARWLGGGPESPLLKETGDEGAAWILGAALWQVDAHGPAFARSFYRRYSGHQPITAQTLDRDYTFVLRQQQRVAISAAAPALALTETRARLDTGANGQPTLALGEDTRVAWWVYVPTGEWTLKTLGEPNGKVGVAVDDQRQILDVGEAPTLAMALATARGGTWRKVVLGGVGTENARVSHLVLEPPAKQPKPKPLGR